MGNCERTREWRREKKARCAVVSWFVALAARNEPSVETFFGSTPARPHGCSFRPSSRSTASDVTSSAIRFILTSSVILSLGSKWKTYPFKTGFPHALFGVIICTSSWAQSPSEKPITSLVMAVRPPVPTRQFFSHRTDFREISYFGIFTKICRNIRILYKSDLSNRQFTRSPGPICATVETGEMQERCEIKWEYRIRDSRIAESPRCVRLCVGSEKHHITRK